MNKPGGLPESVDLEALGLEHMAKFARAATFAPNWKSVLLADAFVGVIIMAIGLAIASRVHWAGWFVAALGVLYVGLVARRTLQWRWLRQQAGIS